MAARPTIPRRSYSIQQCDAFFNCNFFGGFGTIPNTDLSGKGLSGKELHLSTNTSGNPNFFTFGGPTGLVAVDWKANGLFTYSSSGTSQYSATGFTQKSQGTFSYASANATGSVVGMPIPPNNFANVGTNHNVTINIIH